MLNSQKYRKMVHMQRTTAKFPKWWCVLKALLYVQFYDIFSGSTFNFGCPLEHV